MAALQDVVQKVLNKDGVPIDSDGNPIPTGTLAPPIANGVPIGTPPLPAPETPEEPVSKDILNPDGTPSSANLPSSGIPDWLKSVISGYNPVTNTSDIKRDPGAPQALPADQQAGFLDKILGGIGYSLKGVLGQTPMGSLASPVFQGLGMMPDVISAPVRALGLQDGLYNTPTPENNPAITNAYSPVTNSVPKNKVYSEDLKSLEDQADSPQAALQAKQLDTTTQDQQIAQASAMRDQFAHNITPYGRQQYDFYNSQVNTLLEQQSKVVSLNKEKLAQASRWGNRESNDPLATQASLLGETINSLEQNQYLANKHAQAGDLQGAMALIGQSSEQAKRLTGVRITGDNSSQFNSALQNVTSFSPNIAGFSLPQSTPTVYMPQNFESQFKAVQGMITEAKREFKRNAGEVGATPEQQTLKMGTGQQIDNSVPIVSDSKGNPTAFKLNSNGKASTISIPPNPDGTPGDIPAGYKLNEPIVIGFDAGTQKPVYGDSTKFDQNGLHPSATVTTVAKQFDPDSFISDMDQKLSKGNLFSPQQLSILAQSNFNQNADRQYTAGKAMGDTLVKSGEGAYDSLKNIATGKSGMNTATNLNNPSTGSGAVNTNQPFKPRKVK